SLAVNVFNQGDDPIACLNKAMAFLTVVASLSYKGNATSSGGNNAGGQARVVKCYNCQGEGHMARQCTQPKRPRNAAWFKEKKILAEAQKARKILDEEQLAFLDLDAYDSDCDDVSNAKAVLMANLSNYGSDVILEEKANQEKNNESVTAELERYKERVKNLEQRLNIDLSSREKMIDSQMDDMIKENLALKQQIDSLEQNLSNQIKEKESLLQTFTILKKESKEKENKYIDNEIDLEKKIKKLDNIFYKVGQSAQTVHIDINFRRNFGKRFVPQKELSDEQAFSLQTSHPNTDQSALSPVKIEAPQELPKVSMVNTSLKKLKYHLGQFDAVVKKRIIRDAITEGEWGFEHTKTIFLNEIIPFLKTLKDIFDVFDKDLLNEEHIKSMRENNTEEKVKHEMDEIETINIELEHSVAKLLYENERLHKEIEHLKKIYKDQFDSIKKTRALSKEHGKEIVENAAQLPIATTIAPGMFKIDLEPLAPWLLKNKEAHIDYLNHSQEQVDIHRGIVEQAKPK
ncbi:retrovirus-related pol polyprotein from transposon TNT 1-94, partial [Tanacetum coccineum]